MIQIFTSGVIKPENENKKTNKKKGEKACQNN